MQQRTAAFPVGLYGVLLLALCWLAVPWPFRPIERLLLGCCALPQRVWAALAGEAAFAADGEAQARVRGLCADLRERVSAADIGPARALVPSTHEPLVCATVRGERIGGGGRPCELLLDRTYEELALALPLVTKGDVLLGFLLQPGRGVALDDRPGDPARVMLLNHPRCPPLQAFLTEGDVELRMVVRGAGALDPASLRVDLWDDPYRGAVATRTGTMVRVRGNEDLQVPDELRLGHTRVFGYERGATTLTIGVFIDPAIDVRAVSHAVVWTSTPATAQLPPAERATPARLWRMPGDRDGRWYAVLDHAAAGRAAPFFGVPDGAAVARDGMCLGTARGLCFGSALVTSFQASRHPWPLLLLPDAETEPPRELLGEVALADGANAWVRCLSARDGAFGPGFLFTGSGGPHCPPGLLLGRLQGTEGDPELLRVVLPDLRGRVSAAVLERSVPEARD
jgi:hypothetical protein